MNLDMRRSGGFTLIEVLVSLVIFSIAALGVLGMAGTSMTLTANARQSQEAKIIAQQLMEQFQSLPVGNASITGCTSGCWVSQASNTNSTVSTIGMVEMAGGASTAAQVRYQVRWITDSPSSKLRHYGVTTSWVRDRAKQTLLTTDTGFVDCNVTPALCFNYQYHTYRVIP